jgi:prolyl oligopeptidase
MLVTLREDWTVNGKTYVSGSVLATGFDSFKQGGREFTVLFTPSASTSYVGAAETKNFLLLQTLEDVKSRLTEWKLEDGKWSSRQVNLPTMGAVGVAGWDAENSDAYTLSFSDYLTPAVYMMANAGSDQRELLKSAPAFFDASAYETVQQFATSKDGTKVPYFVVKRKDAKLDGNNPTLLYGYGGFLVPLTPSYSGGLGKSWLEKGGVYVVANIRGGGEYGPRWHEAALKGNRQRAYDDFAAVAQDLISKNHQPAPSGRHGRQ